MTGVASHAQAIQKNRELYQFLTELFEPGDLQAFLEATAAKLPSAIRLNPLKAPPEETRARLEHQGFELEPVTGIPHAHRVRKAPFPIGKTLEHFMGYLYVQEVVSMVPPLVLGPEPGMWVLDLAAAPGSKTTQMAEMMQNRGLIVANDIDVSRFKALTHNLDRMGVLNAIVTLVDGFKLGFWFPETFDRVLLDAPCSAIGTLHRAYEILKWWGWSKVGRLVRTQKGLILAGYRALKPGGQMVYSTCTLVPEENEGVIAFLLERFPEAEILPVEVSFLKTRPGLLEWKRNRYPDAVRNTVRVYPQDNWTEGFYIALIRKPEPR